MLAPSLSDSIKPKDPRCLIFSPVAMSSQNKTLQISNQKPWNKKHPSFRTQSDLSMHFLIVCAKKNTAPHKSMVLSGRVTFKKKYFNFTWHRCFRTLGKKSSSTLLPMKSPQPVMERIKCAGMMDITSAAHTAAPEDSETSQVSRKMEKVATEANLSVHIFQHMGWKVLPCSWS